MIAANIAYLLKQEGNDVKLFIDDKERQGNFRGLVNKTNNWKKELGWVGKTGLIVFDDIGYGATQDRLRLQGYTVFGGNEAGDKLEANRQFAQEIFSKYGIKTSSTHDFRSVNDAITFIKKNPGAWVIKQNGGASKSLNYVPHFEDSKDTIAMLESYRSHMHASREIITLQKKIHGVEIATSRFFNGSDWVGPIELNIEHKKFFPTDIGPATSEMGTLAWYNDPESNRLFNETLGKLKPYLQSIDYRGIIDINCIVNETGAYPLEATPRFGSPIVYLQSEMHKTAWTPLLLAVARGLPYAFKCKKGYGIVILVAVPPFPYVKKLIELSPKGLPVYLSSSLTAADREHIHFEGVSTKTDRDDGIHYEISDYQGYVLYVTASGRSVHGARTKAAALLSHIYTPKMFYRHDIGINFIEHTRNQLSAWGYL